MSVLPAKKTVDRIAQSGTAVLSTDVARRIAATERMSEYGVTNEVDENDLEFNSLATCQPMKTEQNW